MGSTAYAYRSTNLEVTNEQIAIPGLRKTVRIAAVSDVHLRCSSASSHRLVTRINESKPDIFVLAGDRIDRKGNEALGITFENVEANHGKLAVLGNWEYQGNINFSHLQRDYEMEKCVSLGNGESTRWIRFLDCYAGTNN